jgi:hypothetical protein
MYLQKVLSKKTIFLNLIFVGLFKVNDKKNRIQISQSEIQRHGSADPDPDTHQDDMDPQHS